MSALTPSDYASIFLAIALLVSEALPFVQDVKSNGITQGIANVLRSPKTKIAGQALSKKRTLTPLETVNILAPDHPPGGPLTSSDEPILSESTKASQNPIPVPHLDAINTHTTVQKK